ncbi:MAG: PaaI family thioesterase [Acidimicrobiia bacterium]|jgi:uncharacterized protein (TIGR00369 family)
MSGHLTPEQVNEFVAEVYPAAFAEGTRCEELGDGWALSRWSFSDGELRPGNYISGPRMFSSADSALWYATFTVIGLEAMAVTAEMSIRFLRPAQKGDLMAKAVINSVSARRLFGTVELWIDGSPDRLVALAQGSYARP